MNGRRTSQVEDLLTPKRAAVEWARLDTEVILAELIASEIRHGRMNVARTRQILRLAREFGISADNAKELLVQCRNHALQSHDPTERRCALRMNTEPETDPVSPHRLVVAIGLVAVLDLAILIYLVW